VPAYRHKECYIFNNLKDTAEIHHRGVGVGRKQRERKAEREESREREKSRERGLEFLSMIVFFFAH